MQIDAVILAGGMGRRMGGKDKGLVELSGKPMIQHTIDRLAPQVDNVMINANRHHEQYRQFGFDVFSDQNSGYLGPIAGMITAMEKTKAKYLLVVPCDCPLLPTDLLIRMKTALEQNDADLAVASDGKREQPVVLLLKPELRQSMINFLDAGDRKVFIWYALHKYVVAEFSDQPNAFVNVNTLEQKQQLAAEITQ